VPDSASSPIAALRAATWPSHQRLEKRIDFKSRLATIDSYRAHLERMWGFYVAIEPRLASGVLRESLTDFDSRRKLPLLSRDLNALGVDAAAVAQLPRCSPVPACDDSPSAFGCAYVLEGATLGGRTLMPLVEARLGLTAEHGAAFLASYGDTVGEMWRSFGEALNRHCAEDEHRARAAAAASATFTALEHWLCGSGA
jgi:heme oxygenase